MTNCCGDYHYSDCPLRTGGYSHSFGDTDYYLDGVEPYDDPYDDEPFVDDDGPLWEDAGMEAGLFGEC